MSANTFPAQIEPFKWAEQGFAWVGQLPLANFTRVAQEAVGSIEGQSVQVECKLSMDSYHPFVWLDAVLRTNIPLQCQRCLQAVNLDVDADVHMAILNDESQVDLLDENADFIVLGDDANTQKADYRQPAVMNLLGILEDELLLSMPISPKHDECEIKHKAMEQAEPEQKKDNPFDVLAGLKGKLGS
ncbi:MULTISPECIES: DUF177 domain-containing protein [unclassified Acinetobacter]|uniref:YceD family protein n=1 Tax=unclassified Acinetobacter TaxID=196816 RepID=UPI0035B93B8B